MFGVDILPVWTFALRGCIKTSHGPLASRGNRRHSRAEQARAPIHRKTTRQLKITGSSRQLSTTTTIINYNTYKTTHTTTHPHTLVADRCVRAR